MNNYEKITTMTIKELAKVIDCPTDIDENYDASYHCEDLYDAGSIIEELCLECKLRFLNSKTIK